MLNIVSYVSDGVHLYVFACQDSQSLTLGLAVWLSSLRAICKAVSDV